MNALSAGVILVLGVICLAAPSTASAGHPHARDGWVAGFSLGGGPGKFSLKDGGSSSTEPGGKFAGRLGKALHPQITLGLEMDGWARTESTDVGDLNFYFVNFLLTGTFFPSTTGGFYLRGGLGGSTITVDQVQGNTTVGFDEGGFGLLAGAGYEWRLGAKTALGIGAGYNHLFISGDVFDSSQFGFIALDLNWYWGTSAPAAE